jgi:hypothetical protein
VSESADVIVIGAGLAGLRAAQVLEGAGRHVTVIEKSTRIGGRVATRHIDGFTIDEGFQLLNPSYPELVATGAIDELDLRTFPSSVVVQRDGRELTVAIPYRDPLAALVSLWRRPVAPRELLPLARLGWRVARGERIGCVSGPDQSTRSGLLAAGLSPRTIDTLMVPFLQGVLLDPHLETSWHYTQMVLRSFLRGAPAVPSRGMAALPGALRRSLERSSIRLAEEVREVSAHRVVTSLGEYEAKHVIAATNDDPSTTWRSVTTWWFAAPVMNDARLRVDADNPRIANLVNMSAAADSYAPPGHSLVAASVIGNYERELSGVVREHAARRFGLLSSDLREIIATPVYHALPALARYQSDRRVVVRNGVVIAGDAVETPSIQGALVSGRRAAQFVLRSK